MGHLTSSQKKGKKSSYTNRFLKKEVLLDAYPSNLKQLEGYTVKQFIQNKSGSAVLMRLVKANMPPKIYVAPRGIGIGTVLGIGQGCSHLIRQLRDCNTGDSICNLEFNTCGRKHRYRAAGTHGRIQSVKSDVTQVVANGKLYVYDSSLRCMQGVPSGSGKKLKPFGLAGSASKAYKAKGKKYVKVSGNAKNIVDCPGGGSSKKKRGISMCVSRNAPPGRKYGSIAASRTGRKTR